jgi:hypothetical protein|nr:MAG TPA: tail fiber protein [Caudoviricetes sp.]
MSNRANLANGITATAISASSNTVALQPGYAAGMPPVPFFATITPFGQLPTMGNSEIVQVTSASGNNLSVVRSQKGTVAKSFPAGSVFTNSVYADDKITADNIDFTTLPDNKYTTNEQDTGQKWIDGRPIYRKVVRGTVNMTGNGTSMLAHGITGLTNRWELISYYGNMRLGGTLSNNPVKQALPYIENTHQSGITSIDQTNITISGSYPWGNSEVIIVLEYVK